MATPELRSRYWKTEVMGGDKDWYLYLYWKRSHPSSLNISTDGVRRDLFSAP